ncbi:PIN domain-like protein [Punctularia strigosozonata HHB-11173 SS5]|uniref:PIN domain-like protein n=1 Tax=Punctularia strigosozonata (strain HHB-11173) TaxID=741275 RepID=UPI00044166E1|nr:PIN domain-like protein [Punctularia strigosozonata HHB-11173 SS5]EIN05889.1 PIN domain-like protein [Punctularia strigosozonata HHB-11173 SS5]
MGVAGLWDILSPAGTLRSLTHLAVVDGFLANPDARGLRIGIDASIWFFHAAYGREGENPELRTLFFRCCKLMTVPFLPVFVFDGPQRPKVKRGKRIGGKEHWMVKGMKNIIEAFGFEWRTAPGEAEAELAYLSRVGIIDAILSDDVDNFLFGATTVIRNPSATLSGNRSHSVKNADGRDDGWHSRVFTAKAISEHPDIQLTRPGMILIGLLSGGDYDQGGVQGCGPGVAHALAKAGFGESLMAAADAYVEDREEEARRNLDDMLEQWRVGLREELTTNKSGRMKSKKPSVAKLITSKFPDVDVLLNYTHPVTSETCEPDIGRIAGICELYFEWGVQDIIIKRFRTVLWPSAVQRIIRRAVLDNQKRRRGRVAQHDCDEEQFIPSTPKKKGTTGRPPPGTPSRMITKYFSSQESSSREDERDDHRLIIKIHSSRTHASTDKVLEYRLEVAPAQLVRMARAGVKGIRPPLDNAVTEDEDEDDEDDTSKGKNKTKKPPAHPDSPFRVWIPECMVRLAEPGLVAEWEETARRKDEKKKGKVKGASTHKPMTRGA